MSSEIIFVDFLILLSSPKDLRALVRASLKPFSWLPPLDVGMVLQKLKNSFSIPWDQPIAHSIYSSLFSSMLDPLKILSIKVCMILKK